MKLNINQFDGGGEGDYLPANPAPAAAAAPAATSYMSKEDRDSGTNAADTAAYAARAAAAKPKNSEYRGNAGGTAAKAIDKSNWDKSTKVPQSTVDAVKDAGRGNMGKVPQRIVKNDAIGLSAPGYVGSQLQYNAPVSKEYKEATKRVYPNEVKTPKTPTFNESSPNAKPFPKIAAPKTKLETVKKLRNAEIEAANKTAPDGKFAAAVINAGKAGAEAYGAGTKTRYQIPGTQTKTQKAQADRRSEMAANKSAAASKPAAAEKIKVSQATVDAVKKAGKAKSTGAANTKGASAEYREAVKRIYPTAKKK
jgi:hypothetical protein